MINAELSRIFDRIADLLEIDGADPFRVNSYRRAGRTLKDATEDVAALAKEGRLTGLPGIGKGTAQRIQQYLDTGRIDVLTELESKLPEGLPALLEIQGMGPKTALLLYKKFKIDSPEKLEKAAKAGKLRDIPGMGAKKEENILRGISIKKQSHGRYLLDDATSHAELIVEELKRLKEVKKILPCGSLRRGQETIGDLDILVISDKPAKVMDKFVSLSAVRDVLAKGATKSSVILNYQT